MSLTPWRIAFESQPPSWFGSISQDEIEDLRARASRVRISELWYSDEESPATLRGNGCYVTLREGETIAQAFGRLLRSAAEADIAEQEKNRDRAAEARESLKRFQGRKQEGRPDGAPPTTD